MRPRCPAPTGLSAPAVRGATRRRGRCRARPCLAAQYGTWRGPCGKTWCLAPLLLRYNCGVCCSCCSAERRVLLPLLVRLATPSFTGRWERAPPALSFSCSAAALRAVMQRGHTAVRCCQQLCCVGVAACYSGRAVRCRHAWREGRCVTRCCCCCCCCCCCGGCCWLHVRRMHTVEGVAFCCERRA